MKCHYERLSGPRCSGPVIVTLHDARGCVDVCVGHAQWRFNKSMAFGSHSATCKHAENARHTDTKHPESTHGR